MINFLKDARIYLSGPIENDSDPISWRKSVSDHLRPLGVRIWDPFDKPTWVSNADGNKQRDWRNYVTCNKDNTDFIWEKNGGLRELSLALASQCDFVIVNLKGPKTYGTLEELSLCRYKPVFIVSDDPIPSMWLLDQLGIRDSWRYYCFTNISDLIVRLNEIDSLGPLDSDSIDPSFDDRIRWQWLSRYVSCK